MRRVVQCIPLAALLLAQPANAQVGPHLVNADARHPLGTQREWASQQQEWLRLRLERTLPMLMRRDSVDMWIIPMREYNEDPVFSSIVAPTTFSARRRTIYVFYDRGAEKGVERLALGGTSQGGMYSAIRSELAATNVSSGRTTAELWGSAQWDVLTKVIRDRKPKRIALDRKSVV